MSEYFILGASELPVKVVQTGNRVQVLTYHFETGDFIPNITNLATLYYGPADVERVSEHEFEDYVAKLRELCHLDAPRYYIINKLPIKALPVNNRYPDVQEFNIETDEFDVLLSYFDLVRIRLGEIGRVTWDEFEHCMQEIRIWCDHLQVPKYYIVSGQPIKVVRADDGKLRLFGYFVVTDSLIPSGWKWRSLIPPINPDWVSEVSESNFRQQIEEKRTKFQEWRQRTKS